MIRKIQTFLGVTMAVASSLIVLVVFMGSEPLSEAFSKLPFMKVDPLYTGGKVEATYPLKTSEGTLQVSLHESVFSALTGTPKNGFRQVDFTPGEGMELPRIISAPLDLDRDGTFEVSIRIDTQTGQSQLSGDDIACYAIQASARVKEKWILRVSMKRTKDEGPSCASCASQGSCPLARLLSAASAQDISGKGYQGI